MRIRSCCASLRTITLTPYAVLLLFFTCCGFVFASSAEQNNAGDSRPNILLLFGDDLGRYASAYASEDTPGPNDVIDTPTFDRIAREGALFNNAFVSVPSCTPSRASLYTGRHFFRNGSHSQLHHPWQRGASDPFEDVVGMPNNLAKAGYHIGWSHKWHMRTNLIGGKENQYDESGNLISRYSQYVSRAEDRKKAKQRVLESVRENFRDFLSNREPDQPFFYSFNPTNTHRSWVAGSGKDLWGIEPDELIGKLPPFLPDVPEIRQDFADYLGEVMAFDAACGVILEELEARGELDNTLVCITGDHGAPGFPRGKCNVYDFGARVLLAMRWPGTIAKEREVQTPVSFVDLAPTFLDAAGLPPYLEANGESLLPAVREGGTDENLRGWALIGREAHVNTCRPGGLPYPIRAIRTDDFLYIVNFKPDRWPVANPPLSARFEPAMTGKGENARRRMDVDHGPTLTWFIEREGDPSIAKYWEWGFGQRPEEELYDVREDPHQIQNLASKPEWQEKREELRQQLFEELKANEDPRLDDEFDRLPYNVNASSDAS